MDNLAQGIQSAIDFIEQNICEDITISQIASKACISEFYFQKIFGVLCSQTVGEYIRNRRLTLAAEEILSTDEKIIDIALKYGYESHDSFTRAFTRFHGVSPTAAREKKASIKSISPIRIKLKLEGGNMIEYRISQKAAFTIKGFCRRFNTETSYTEVPKFWQEHYASGGGEKIKGVFGACVDSNGKEFDYYIADLYLPCFEIEKEFKTITFEAGLWAVFPYSGKCPEALQNVNTKIWSEWLPNCREYELAGNYNLEFYIDPDHGEIWVPVKKV